MKILKYLLVGVVLALAALGAHILKEWWDEMGEGGPW